MAKHKLSVKTVEERLTEVGRYSDGGGLWLQISKWGTKSWLFQYASPTQTVMRKRKVEKKDGTKEEHEIEIGKVRQLGLGSCLTVSLAKARAAADQMREQVAAGIDPVEAKEDDRHKKRLAAAKLLTFRQCAEDYIATHRSGWRNEKHAAQWSSTLKTYAYPIEVEKDLIIGDVSVAAIDTKLVHDILKPIWTSKPETAKRLRGRIEQVLDYATAMKARSGENPARWKSNLKHLLAKQDKRERHHPALPYSDIGTFMAELRACQGLAAQALEVTILTALRTSEVINAKWEEIDFRTKTWTIPGERIKGGKTHRVPLTEPVLDILRQLPREDGQAYVFPGRKDQPLSNMAMLKTLGEFRPGLTVHGFRSTFRDWTADQTSFPNIVAEMALAHVVGDKVEAAYRRSDLFDKRRKLMEAWADNCDRPSAPPSGNVTPLRRGRRTNA